MGGTCSNLKSSRRRLLYSIHLTQGGAGIMPWQIAKNYRLLDHFSLVPDVQQNSFPPKRLAARLINLKSDNLTVYV